MKLLIPALLIFGLHPLSFGQYCMSGGPSSTADSNIESVSLFGDAGGITYTGCPGSVGVTTYTAQSVSLGQGNSYSIDVQFGTCGGNYSSSGEVWIDFNGNFTFEPSESIGTWNGVPPTPMSTFNFTVPSGATLGSTRMRIIQAENLSNPINPCASFTWGSATDFIINIIQGVDCTGYQGDDMADAIDVTTLPYTHNHSNAVCYSDQHTTYASPDVYYRVTTDPANPLTKVSLCGSSFDTFLSIVEPNGSFIAGNDDAPGCSSQSEVIFDASTFPVFYVIVEGWGTNAGDYTLTINDQIAGIGDETLGALTLYPNPTQHSVNLNNEQPGKIELMNARGELIRAFDIEAFGTVYMEDLVNGIYFLKYQVGTLYNINKIIKN